MAWLTDLPSWVLWIGVLSVLVLALAWLLMAFDATVTVDEARNRPAPPGMIEQHEQRRIDALRRIAARHREQQQRDASARITRG